MCIRQMTTKTKIAEIHALLFRFGDKNIKRNRIENMNSISTYCYIKQTNQYFLKTYISH